jgi:phospholipase C
MRRSFMTILLLASLAQCQSLKHVIFIVKENRSFDHYFGQFPGVTGGPTTSYACFGTQGGCTGGSLAVIPGNPNMGDADCGHYYANSISDYHSGTMDKFNQNCSGSSDWAKQYGQLCHGGANIGKYCSTNADCPGSTCVNTLEIYWSYATRYGLADHMFASAMGPSYPNHLYIIAATSNEAQDNPQMTPGRPPNGEGGNGWTCDAFHYGRCASGPEAGALCSTSGDCSGSACNINSGTGTCSVGGESCTFNTDCSSGYCTNGDVYVATSGAFYGIDILGGTGKQMFPGVCHNHRTVGCNSICSGPGHGCNVVEDCYVLGPTANCNIADPICTALNPTDVCDASSRQFLSAGRGSACPNVTTIADRLDTAGVTWGMYYATGNANSTGQNWNPVGYVQHLRYGSDWTRNVHPDTQFASDAAASKSPVTDILPSVVWVDGSGVGSEHPSQPVLTGELWTATQVNAIRTNPYLWSNSTIFITWDDFGGFADHVPPPQDPINWTNGMRVPLLCVGRFCKNQITTTQFTPASLLKCIENIFNVPALISGVDGTANDVCLSPGGMMSLQQENPFPGDDSVAGHAVAGLKHTTGGSLH